MFIRPIHVNKDGKRHAYWALVESYRTQRGPRQRTVAYLGQLDKAGRLGVREAATATDHRSYQGQLFDDVEPRWVEVDINLKQRLGRLFDLEYDLLLYDVTSTYFEGQAAGNALAQYGHSRDKRSDCKQVCIALVVSRWGMPVGYEVFAGNRSDVTTVEQIVEAHILVCFLAYVLWKTLGQLCRQKGLGNEPRRVIDELSQIRMVDVVLPTRSGIEIRRRCISQPTEHQAILLHHLGLNLPTHLPVVEQKMNQM